MQAMTVMTRSIHPDAPLVIRRAPKMWVPAQIPLAIADQVAVAIRTGLLRPAETLPQSEHWPMRSRSISTP
jgi:hypothetical protein